MFLPNTFETGTVGRRAGNLIIDFILKMHGGGHSLVVGHVQPKSVRFYLWSLHLNGFQVARLRGRLLEPRENCCQSESLIQGWGGGAMISDFLQHIVQFAKVRARSGMFLAKLHEDEHGVETPFTCYQCFYKKQNVLQVRGGKSDIKNTVGCQIYQSATTKQAFVCMR